MMKSNFLLSAPLVVLLALGACQSSGQPGGGLEDGSAAPESDILISSESPDGPPDECVNDGSEGTSLTPGC